MKSNSSESRSGLRCRPAVTAAATLARSAKVHLVAGARVAAVDRERGEHLAERLAQFPAGVVALAAVPLADVGELRGQPLDLGGQVLGHDLELGVVADVGEAGVLAGEAGIAVEQGSCSPAGSTKSWLTRLRKP